MTKENKSMGGMKTVLVWTMFVSVLALILLVMLILFGNLLGSVGFGQDSAAFTHHTVTLDENPVNVSDLTSKVNPGTSGITVVNATNVTGATVPSSNYSVIDGKLVATGDSIYNGSSVNVSGNLLFDSQGKIDADNLIFNYTRGVTNTSAQFPVVGTIIGVALLLIVLIGVLIFAIKKLGGAGSFGGSGGSSKFGGDTSSGIA
jgi:hypothetical protein